MSVQCFPRPTLFLAAAAIGGALFPAAVPSRAEVPEVPPSVRASDITEAAPVRDLIQQLVKIDHADFGVTSYSLDGFGMAFAPDAAPDSQMPFRRPDTRRERFPAFVELVRLGPRVLPYLLQAMDDPTPTRLPIYHGAFDMMSTVVLPGNRANTRETRILAGQSDAHRRALEAADKAGRPVLRNQMTLRNPDFVTVGDICITAIGQITGRDYQHLRFAGDGGENAIVLDYDSVTPAALRAIWSDCDTPDNASRQLLDSLLLDYHSRSHKFDRSFDPEAPASATTGRSPRPSGLFTTIPNRPLRWSPHG